MSEQELCEVYGVDWHGPYAYEAADRLALLNRYRSPEYPGEVSVRGDYASEFEFASERRYTEDTEQWANERGLEQVAQLARQVTDRLEGLARFSRRLAKQVREEVTDQLEESHDLRDWSTRLEEGDFDPVEVISIINKAAEDDPGKAMGQGHVYLEALYPFVASVVSDAHERFDGQLGPALAARFNHPPDAQWTHYRGFSAYIWQSPDATGSTEGEPFFCEVIAAPDQAPRWSSPPVNAPGQALALLRAEVDTFWRQNPPGDPDTHNTP